MIHARRFNRETAPITISLEKVTRRVCDSVRCADFDEIPAMLPLRYIFINKLVVSEIVVILGVYCEVIKRRSASDWVRSASDWVGVGGLGLTERRFWRIIHR